MLIIRNNVIATGSFTLLTTILSFLSILVVTLGEKYGRIFSVVEISLYTFIVITLYFFVGRLFIETVSLRIHLKFLSTISIIIILYISIASSREGFPQILMPFYPACMLLQNLLNIGIERTTKVFAVVSYLTFMIGANRQVK